MNKIIMDKEEIVNLKINGNEVYNISRDYEIKQLNIEIENNSKVIINHFSEIEKSDLKINVIENNNSEFIYNHSFKNSKFYNIDINIEMKGNNSKNEVNIHGISDGGKSNIKIDGKVFENTMGNELYENVKILNINNGFSYIYPNMFIDTKNVIANHSASITNINKDYLFYLNSRGINEDEAKKLIIEGFLENEAR